MYDPTTEKDVTQPCVILTLAVDNPAKGTTQALEYVLAPEAARKMGAALINCAP